MKTFRNSSRFQYFFSQFKKLNIIRDLEDSVDLWSYNKLDEVNRISSVIKENKKKCH